MQFFNALCLISTLLLAILSNAAPTTGKGKGKDGTAGLQVLLRETRPNSDDWHFAVAIRGPGKAKEETVYEYTIQIYPKQLARSITVKSLKSTAGSYPVSGDVLKAGGESDLNALAAKIKSIIIDKVPIYVQIPAQGPFDNCFDFANNAFTALHNAKYISDVTMNKFTKYFDAHKDQVHALTDEHTRQLVYPAASSSKKHSH